MRAKRRKQLVGLLLFFFVPAICLTQTTEPAEVIRIESDLVDLKVRVVSLSSLSPVADLRQEDFRVLEDGKPQEISFFAAAEAPFDLVLLLDLSGSTVEKLKLIKSSARRFVEATRPKDRVAIVAFTDLPQVVCPLTSDRELLKNSIGKIEKPVGATSFWDCLRYVLENVLPSGAASRRNAVVVMTDGVDNALPDVFGEGSRTSFTELLEIVRNSDAIIFPVYLDTENEEVKRHRTPRSAFAIARNQLNILAEACGTRLYRANRVEDLKDAYKTVIRDLGRVYSIGYRPSNLIKDGKWRSVAVQLVERHDVTALTKLGYFAKASAGQ